MKDIKIFLSKKESDNMVIKTQKKDDFNFVL